MANENQQAALYALVQACENVQPPLHRMEHALHPWVTFLIVPVFAASPWLLVAALPFIAFGAVVSLTLPYALLMREMPPESHGATSGLYDVSGGLGELLGPLLTGVAIDALGPLFPSTHGYAAMWTVVSASALLSILALRRTKRQPPRSV